MNTKHYELTSEKDASITLKVIENPQTGSLYVRLAKPADEPGKYLILHQETGSSFGLDKDALIKQIFDLIRTAQSNMFFREIVANDQYLELYCTKQHDKLAELLPNWGYMMEFYTQFSRDIMGSVWTHPSLAGKFNVKHTDTQRVSFDKTVVFVHNHYRFNRAGRNGGAITVATTVYPTEKHGAEEIVNGQITISRIYGRKDNITARAILKEERNAAIIRTWLSYPSPAEEIMQGFDQ